LSSIATTNIETFFFSLNVSLQIYTFFSCVRLSVITPNVEVVAHFVGTKYSSFERDINRTVHRDIVL